MKTKLILILLLSLGLRLVLLDSRPLGFTWDEAAHGYNAYSLLKTGRDEYGKILPLVLKSFGDYKPGLYTYFTVFSVGIFGLNEFATRLPSAVFGVLLVAVIYLLSKNKLAALLLAINPWAIQFSRGSWEANLSLLLTTLGAVLFIRKRFWLSALFFGLTFWSYQGAKMFTPLLVISLFLIYRPAIKSLIKPLLLLLLLLLPIGLGFSTQSGRLKVFSVFSYTRSADVTDQIKHQDSSPLYFPLFHSEGYDQLRGITRRYLNHLSPYYLFVAGDWTNLRQSIPYYGYFHLPEIITILIGLIVLLRTNNQLTKLLFVWLLLAILPSALSRDLVSGVRSLPMVIPLTIISAIGLSKAKYLLPVILIFFIYFLDLYFLHLPYFTGKDWLYPYKPAFKLVSQYQDNYNRIIFTNTLGQPYIFMLFYYQIDPATYQAQSKLIADAQGDVGQVTKYGKFVFKRVDWPAERGDSSTIFVGDQFELPEQDMNPTNIKRLGEIYYPNGAHALRIVVLE
ncbi:MAG: glycosyltransferase family 39 protein [Patescibacteria group bacterium]